MSTCSAPHQKSIKCDPRHSGETLPLAARSTCSTCGRNESTKTNDPTILDILFTSFIPAVLSFTLPYAYVLGYYAALYCLRRGMSRYHARTIKEKMTPADEVLGVVARVVQHATSDPHLHCINRFGSNQVVNHDSRIDLKRRGKTRTFEDVRSILQPYQNSSILIRDPSGLKHRGYERPEQATKVNELWNLVILWHNITSKMVSAGYLVRISGAYNERFHFQEGDMVGVRGLIFLEHQQNSKSGTEWDEGDIVEVVELVEMWDSLTIEMCDQFYLAIFPDGDS